MKTIVDRVLSKMVGRIDCARNNCDRDDGWVARAFASSESLENLFKEIESEKR